MMLEQKGKFILLDHRSIGSFFWRIFITAVVSHLSGLHENGGVFMENCYNRKEAVDSAQVISIKHDKILHHFIIRGRKARASSDQNS